MLAALFAPLRFFRPRKSSEAAVAPPALLMSERINFGKIKEGAEPPNLIEIQLDSYIEFLQTDVQVSKRKETGLQAVFKEVFPITSYDEKVTLDFSSYEIGEPKLSIREAMREGL